MIQYNWHIQIYIGLKYRSFNCIYMLHLKEVVKDVDSTVNAISKKGYVTCYLLCLEKVLRDFFSQHKNMIHYRVSISVYYTFLNFFL